MIKLISTIIVGLFLFTGCYSKTPKTEVIVENKTKIIVPDYSHYEFYTVPTLDPNISKKTKDEALDALLEYSIKLQTTIFLYQSRTTSLKEWRDDMLKIYEEAKYE